ncbi:MAG: putative sugar O-methyltransferase [Phycisphaerae bacterium]|nr:putative sugar O-methyltransferase [Gemmatimonadaceae bacterium]
MSELIQRLAERWLNNRGVSLVSTRSLKGFDRDGASRPTAGPPLAPEDDAYLRLDNPVLVKLGERIAATSSPATVHSVWNPSFVSKEVSLGQFRGHSAYVWSYGELPRPTVLKYFIYAQDVARRTGASLEKLMEDGAFGSLSFDFDGLGRVSRDRLDSALELDFVQRTTGLLTKPGVRVLDVGAGYGRLAHRTCELADVADYACVDAIPLSTFLCEFYLRHRKIDDRARSVPLDEVIERNTALGRFDIAFNVHSWSECTLAAVAWWVQLIARLEVPYLFVVPNQHDRFITREQDSSRADFLPTIQAAGYELIADEWVFEDANVRRLLAIPDRLYMFQRK